MYRTMGYIQTFRDFIKDRQPPQSIQILGHSCSIWKESAMVKSDFEVIIANMNLDSLSSGARN